MGGTIFVKVCLAIVQTFVFYSVGAFALKRRMIPKEALAGLSHLAVDVLTPCLIFYSVTANFTRNDATTIFLLPMLGIGMVTLHAALGYAFLPWLKHKEHGRSASFLYTTTMNNYLFLPLIIVNNLWGSREIGALLLWSVGTTFAQWTIGVAVMSGTDWKQLAKNILSPNLGAVILALICVFSDWKPAMFFMQILKSLGDLSISLSLLLVGASIFNSKGKLFEYPLDGIYAVLVRMAAVPVFTLLILKCLPLPLLAYRIAVVVAVMPAVSSSVLIVRNYGGCVDFAGQAVVFSSVVSLLTVPTFIYWML